MRMHRTLGMGLVAAVTVLGLAACGDDDESSSAGDAERYCELVGEIEAAGEAAFADVGEDATPDEIVAAEAAFVESVDAELDEMVEVAPEEIAEDVEAYVADVRDRAAGNEGSDVSASEERILAFEDANC
jgi:hypothetical protein